MLGTLDNDLDCLVGYSDSDWAHNIDDRHSISGYMFQLRLLSMSWGSKKQPTIATSPTKGEYMMISYSIKQELWLCYFLTEIGLDPNGTLTTLFIDNIGAIELSKETCHHSRTKHINVHHHFICSHVTDKTFIISHIPLLDQLTDICTKPLIYNSFSHLLSHIGLSVKMESQVSVVKREFSQIIVKC